MIKLFSFMRRGRLTQPIPLPEPWGISSSWNCQPLDGEHFSDADPPALALRDPRGSPIRCSLSFLDLFSFEVIDPVYRLNLESAFQQYEQMTIAYTKTLLAKLRTGDATDLTRVVTGLFAAKLLNFLRNPYSVKKILNTFGAAADVAPTDPILAATHASVRHGSRPHRERVCQWFDLTTELYDRWLVLMFNMLSRSSSSTSSLFGDVIKRLFEEFATFVQVYEYDDNDPRQRCLLSDRGFNVPLPSGSHFLAIDFNLTARAFARFIWSSPKVCVNA